MRCIVLILAAMVLPTLATAEVAVTNSSNKPNIVMIVVDDMRFDEFSLGGHPFLDTPQIDKLAKNGVNFSRAYHVSPLCSPNRASLLTGQYVARHGVLDNTSRSNLSHRLALFPKLLKAAGYRTAHIGKWHMGNDPTPRPGYDYWVSYAGHGKLVNPELYERGKTGQVKGYITDILTERAVQFIHESAEQPFFLYVGHKAVHPEASQRNDGSADLSVIREYIPAERHQGRYKDASAAAFRGQERYSETGLSRPLQESLAIRKKLAQSDQRWNAWIQSGFSHKTIRKRAEMMLSVDESLGSIIETLDAKGLLDKTLIIFTSDNGYFFGEHGLTIERRYPYEEAIKAPLIIKKPNSVPPLKKAALQDMLVSSVDLAPTILEYAGLPVSKSMQGVSFYPVLEKSKPARRDSVFVEHYAHENPFSWTAKVDYKVLISGQYKLIKWTKYEAEYELYNLQEDPFELKDLARDAEQQTRLATMQNQLKRETLNSIGFN